METIEKYLESMFISLPETAEIVRLKSDMLENMEDRYRELKETGINENEAIGTVISEFGNIDEILDELEIQGKKVESAEEDLLPVVDHEMVFDYLQMKRKIGINIGVGVILNMVGVASLLFIMGLLGETDYSTMLGLIPMFLFCAIGVGFLILGGFRQSRYEYLDKSFVILKEVRQDVEAMKKNNDRSFTLSMIVGVVICIVSVIPIFIGSVILDATADFELIGVSVLLLIASFGVFFFIYAGNVQGGFTKLLENGRSTQPTKAEHGKEKISYVFDSIFWPVLLFIYFVWSFKHGAWYYSWLIFPVGGIIENAVRGALGIYKKK